MASKDALPGYHDYTGYNTRGVVHNGRFEYPKDGYRPGMEVLVERECKYTGTYLTAIIESVVVEYVFNGQPVYRCWLKHGGGGWLNPLVHVSTYDQIVKIVEEDSFLKSWNELRTHSPENTEYWKRQKEKTEAIGKRRAEMFRNMEGRS